MFDIRIGNINLGAVMLVVSTVAVLPAQLLLCFRVKSRRLRFMPVIIFSLAAAADIILYLTVSGWKRAVFAVCAMYIGSMLLACGAGWAVWAVIKKGGGPP